MKKYQVIGIVSASIVIGEYDAEDEADAIEKAESDKNANWSTSLCWECSKKIEVGDVSDIEAFEIN